MALLERARRRPPRDARLQVLVVSTNYAPEVTGVAAYSTQIAEHLAHDGAAVEVLAGMPHYPAWRVDEPYRGMWRGTERLGGVTVLRRRHTVPHRQTAVRRGLLELSFLVHGTVAPPRRRPDVVLSQMPTLSSGVLGHRIARHWGVPHVTVVQDLLGAGAVQSGLPGGAMASGVAGRVEASVLRGAARVGVIHESFLPGVLHAGVARDDVELVPNWSHIRPWSGDRDAVRAELGWDDGRTVVLHAGNMGLKQGLEVVVRAARLAEDTGAPVRFVLMGDGNQRAALEEAAAGVGPLDFLPPAPEDRFPAVLGAADTLLVTQRAAVTDMSIPSKLTSYFATGRPVVASVAATGGTADELRRSGAGTLVPPEDPRALLEGVLALRRDHAHAERRGAAGRTYVTEHLGRRAGLARIDGLIAGALADRR